MRYFIGFLITLGLIILLIVLLLGGGGKSKKPVTSKTLDSYASTNAQVRLTIDGPVNANSEHEQISITVDNNNVTYERLSGYEGVVVDTRLFSNNEDAYSAFLLSLAHAGFAQGNTDKALSNEQGYCPTGDRYIFELTKDGENLQRFWATSCGNPKTYQGNRSLTLTLFQKQVPGYNDLTRHIQL